jgi:hypothetical protein
VKNDDPEVTEGKIVDGRTIFTYHTFDGEYGFSLAKGPWATTPSEIAKAWRWHADIAFGEADSKREAIEAAKQAIDAYIVRQNTKLKLLPITHRQYKRLVRVAEAFMYPAGAFVLGIFSPYLSGRFALWALAASLVHGEDLPEGMRSIRQKAVPFFIGMAVATLLYPLWM